MAPRKKVNAGMSEYEKMRLRRIQENNARLAELGLVGASSSLAVASQEKVEERKEASSVPPRRSARLRGNSVKGKEVLSDSDPEENEEDEEELCIVRKVEDDEYVPPAVEQASSESEDTDVEDQLESPTEDTQVDEDELQQAIALSLEEPNPKRRRSEPSSKSKRKTAKRNVFQLTEADVDLVYHTIVGTGRGVTVKELREVAALHDFTWDSKELQQMISIFDNDKDYMLNLAEFRTMASRSRILQDI